MCFICCLCAIVKHQRLDAVILCAGGSWSLSGLVRTGQLERGQGAHSREVFSPVSCLHRSLRMGAFQLGEGELEGAFLFLLVIIQCCTMGLGLLLRCSVANLAAVCVAGKSGPVCPREKFPESCFSFPTQLLHPSTGEEPLGQSSRLVFGWSVLFSVGFRLSWGV